MQAKNLTPREIVNELNRYIIGQDDAKKAVAIALRNRYRRKNVPLNMQDEIIPKNILMVGPTGCGKTEISRRLAKLAHAPFIKIEATKFTEVGYVGKDVESIIRDLTEQSINLTRDKYRNELKGKAEKAAENRIIDALVGKDADEKTRDKFYQMLTDGQLADKEVELELQDNSSNNPLANMLDMPGGQGQMGMFNLNDLLGKGFNKTKLKKIKIKDAYSLLIAEEADKLMDEDKIIQEAVNSVENDGIVFLDEIDKITAKGGSSKADVSREGVQRDLLPLIEGTVVTTKYGVIKTDHILFIASGAFHVAKPADLLPELQGRLPIRVQLQPLSCDDILRILSEPEASLISQYTALMQADNVALSFTEPALQEIANLAFEANENVENIGARRLHTIIEKLLQEISFEAGDTLTGEFIIDKEYVINKLNNEVKKENLDKFIL